VCSTMNSRKRRIRSAFTKTLLATILRSCFRTCSGDSCIGYGNFTGVSGPGSSLTHRAHDRYGAVRIPVDKAPSHHQTSGFAASFHLSVTADPPKSSGRVADDRPGGDGKRYGVTRVLSRKINSGSNGDNTSACEKVLDFSSACSCSHTSFKNHLGTFGLAET
jgi:hypothetical protein